VRDRIADDYLPDGAVSFMRAAARVLPTAVVANSRATLATLPAVVRGQVMFDPITPQDAERARMRRRTGDNTTIFGIVGRLAPWKGQDVFLAAFAEAFRGAGVRARVIGSPLFGEDAFADGLIRQAKELGIGDQVEFRGFCDDIWAELAELDVLVHSSVVPEPFGQTVLEGMAAGMAVIAARSGGPAELITDGMDGLLTSMGDVHELAEALRLLERDPALRAALGAAAQKKTSEFTPERAASVLLAIYRELVPF
jgi:glycosyltransferase involved in cell wall biosynthesis